MREGDAGGIEGWCRLGQYGVEGGGKARGEGWGGSIGRRQVGEGGARVT